jgi:hypothetical protein
MGELVEDLRTQLIDQDTGFFRRWNSEDRLDIYQTGLGRSFTTVIDGFGISAPWQQDFGRPKSETLCRALKDTSLSWSAVYTPTATAWQSRAVHGVLKSETAGSPADYPGHFEVRRVFSNGTVSWHNAALFVTGVLAGDVGFEPIDDGVWTIHFGHLIIGRYDEREHVVYSLEGDADD